MRGGFKAAKIFTIIVDFIFVAWSSDAGFIKQLPFGSGVNQRTPGEQFFVDVGERDMQLFCRFLSCLLVVKAFVLGMGSTVVDCQQGSSCLRLNQRPSRYNSILISGSLPSVNPTN